MADVIATGDTSETTTSRMTSSFIKIGDRTRFTVELKPGETTIVSWKKLMKDASKTTDDDTTTTAAADGGGGGGAPPQPPVNSIPALESRLAPGQPIAKELNDAPPPNRFSAVIEKIERLYTGDSSDEEVRDDIPDDDQYDTEDSFIDDAELDEYFEVDKSKTKHDGYFVNRGILEKVEPLELANPQPKKRRRKEVAKAPGDNVVVPNGNNHMIPSKKGTTKSTDKSGLPAPQLPLKKLENSKPSLDPIAPLRTSPASTLSENTDKQRTGTFQAKSSSGKPKFSSENGDKSEHMHKTQSLKKNKFEGSELVALALQKDKSGMRGRIDLNLPDNKQTVQPMKNSLLHKKEGPSVKSKVNALEKSIRELEKMVAESRPPAPDAQEADSSGLCTKRRLPDDIKQKLAKVARLAHATNGKVSNELQKRLMGILGHLIQIRTLRRHLKVMMTTGLTAKQEKDDKFQQAKKEVIEMLKIRIPSLMTKATQIQSQGSGNVQESVHSEKTVKEELCMDITLEDKICDLYDIFVDGLDEDALPQVRKLYAELAELWPKGVMDNHGIKRAICRAKERKKTLNEKNKDHEKAKRKRALALNTEETVRVESSSAVQSQSQYVDARVVAEPTLAVMTQQHRFPSVATTTAPVNTSIHEKAKRKKAPALNTEETVRVESSSAVQSQSQYVDARVVAEPTLAVMTQQNRFPSVAPTTAPVNTSIHSSAPISSTNGPHSERPKHEKGKVNHNQPLIDGGIVKKKVKRKAENSMGELPLKPQKPSSHQGDDRQKHQKHVSGQVHTAPHNSSYTEFRFEPLT